jgi:hypothetical protein
MTVKRRTMMRTPDLSDRASILRRRASRHARRGEYRKAAVAMRQVAALRGDAASWVALGDMLNRASRPGEAVQALKQGLWLHRQAGSEGRARTVARMILAVDPHDAHASRLVQAA